MGSQILFGRKDIEQDAVQQVAAWPRIIFDQDIFEFDNLHLDLVVMFTEDRDIVFRVLYALQQPLYIREHRFLFVGHMFVDLCGIVVKEFGNDESYV